MNDLLIKIYLKVLENNRKEEQEQEDWDETVELTNYNLFESYRTISRNNLLANVQFIYKQGYVST